VADEMPDKNLTASDIESPNVEDSGPSLNMATVDGARFADEREKIEELLQVDVGSVTRTEVSASTIVKMMGLSTSSEMKLIEGKLDLLAGRLGNLSIRLERVMNLLNNTPSVSDFERIESQIASLRSMFKEIITHQSGASSSTNSNAPAMSPKGMEKTPEDKVQAFLSKNQFGSAAAAAEKSKK
jgi:hypothetical protein